MYFVAEHDQKWAILASSDGQPPVVVGTYDSDDEANQVARKMNMIADCDPTDEPVPDELIALLSKV